MPKPITVVLETGRTKTFASAVDWPGWCRAGRTEEAALEALAAYAARYALVTDAAGVRFPGTAGDAFTVAERLPGNASTDFGAPGAIADADRTPTTGAQANRLTVIVRAAWTVFDRIAADTPPELRKGPRGGGRDRDKMIDHVIGAEVMYARKIGLRHRQPAITDRTAIEALRDDVSAVLGQPSDGSPTTEKGWPVRYAARRVAWHVLDHGWEMQDRTS